MGYKGSNIDITVTSRSPWSLAINSGSLVCVPRYYIVPLSGTRSLEYKLYKSLVLNWLGLDRHIIPSV